MVAIVKENGGTDEFKEKYWADSVYVDEQQSLFKGIHDDKQVKSATILNFALPSFWGNVQRASKLGYEGNMVGEGFVLGGLLIFAEDGSIHYKYPEKDWGDHAPLKEVWDACKSLATTDIQEAFKKEPLDLQRIATRKYCAEDLVCQR